jgi:hypothetical protein
MKNDLSLEGHGNPVALHFRSTKPRGTPPPTIAARSCQPGLVTRTLLRLAVTSESGSLSGNVAFGPDISSAKSEVITVHPVP